MIIAERKYDLYSHISYTETEILHAQTACLYWKKNETVERIAEITGYTVGTVKSYVRKYSYMTEEYDAYFNPNAPHKTYEARKPLPFFEDGYIKCEVPEDCGLYLIGSTHFDPITGKRYCWIKIGMGSDLSKRLRSYRTENPMVFIADTMIVDPEDVMDFEKACHIALSDIAQAQAEGTQEWFLVDEQTYMEICNKGFGYFFTVK